jgi:hypothetical protein
MIAKITVQDVFGVILVIISCLIIMAIVGGAVYFMADECQKCWNRKRKKGVNHNRHNRTQ